MSSTTFFFLFIPLLSFVLLAVNLVFAPHNPYQEKDSAFECGFSSFLGQNRTQFSISFFIFALLFLLFDLEILLVYPYLVSAYTNGVYGLTVMLVFLLALTLGFAFELGKKALSIDSRQILSSPPKPHAFISLPVQSGNLYIINKYMPLAIYLTIVLVSTYTLDQDILFYMFENLYLTLVVLCCMLPSNIYSLYLLTVEVNSRSEKWYDIIKHTYNYFKLFYQNTLDCKTWCKKFTYVLFIIIVIVVFFILQILLISSARGYLFSFFGITMNLNHYCLCVHIILFLWVPSAYMCRIYTQWMISLSNRYRGIYNTNIDFSLSIVKNVITRKRFAIKLGILLGIGFNWYYMYDILKSNCYIRPVYCLGLDNDDVAYAANHPVDDDDNASMYKHFVVGKPLELVDENGNRVDLTNHYIQTPKDHTNIISNRDLENNGYVKDHTGTYLKSTGNNITEKVCYTPINEDYCISSTLAKSYSTNMLNKMATYRLPIRDIIPAIPHGQDLVKPSNLKDCYANLPVFQKQGLAIIDNPGQEHLIKHFAVAMTGYYFRPENGFLPGSESKSGIGQVDIIIKSDAYVNETRLRNMGCGELKSQEGDSYTSVAVQATRYADNDNDTTKSIVYTIKGTKIAFFIYDELWHSSRGFKLKGIMFDGLLGLYNDREGVKVLPQENTFAPQAMYYNYFSIDNNPVYASDVYSVHLMFKYLSMSHHPPIAEIDEDRTTNPPKLSINLRALEPHSYHTEAPVVSSVNTDLGIRRLALDRYGKFPRYYPNHF